MRVQRRRLVAGLGIGLITASTAAFAQSLGKRVHRIGWLVTGDPTSYRFSLAAFRDGLRSLNYVEGQNIVIEYRWAEGRVERLPELAKELAQLKVDVILAGGTNGARAAMAATAVIPIVTAGAGDLLSAGLVASLARPGGNLTGFPVVFPETAVKQLEVIKQLLPRSQKGAVLWLGPGNSFVDLQRKFAEEAAATLRLALTWHAADHLPELEAALERIPTSQAEFLVVLSTPFFFTYRQRITAFAAQAKLPAAYTLSEFVDDGGLISYGANIPDTYRRAAGYIDKILKGARPADLPVELPATFELVINMKTARGLGIALPQSVLLRASRVIE